MIIEINGVKIETERQLIKDENIVHMPIECIKLKDNERSEPLIIDYDN